MERIAISEKLMWHCEIAHVAHVSHVARDTDGWRNLKTYIQPLFEMHRK